MASPDKIIATAEAVYRFLPQRPPMVMIDTFLSCADKITITSLTVLKENIFIKDGCLAEPGIIENIAQTAAAGLGYSIVNSTSDKPVPVGVIGGIKNLHIYSLPKIGDVITTEVRVMHEVLNASVIYGKVIAGNNILAEGEMKIFLIENQDN